MEINETRELVKNTKLIKQLIDFNNSIEFEELSKNQFDYISPEFKQLFDDAELNSYALRVTLSHNKDDFDPSSNFILFKNSFDNLALLSEEKLKQIVFYVGAVVVSKYFFVCNKKDYIDFFQKIVGKQLFSFILNYGRFAPYDKDLDFSINEDLTKKSFDEISNIITLLGIRCLVSISFEFSTESLKKYFMTKLNSVFGDFNMNHKITMESKKISSPKRILSLINKIIKF